MSNLRLETDLRTPLALLAGLIRPAFALEGQDESNPGDGEQDRNETKTEVHGPSRAVPGIHRDIYDAPWCGSGGGRHAALLSRNAAHGSSHGVDAGTARAHRACPWPEQEH